MTQREKLYYLIEQYLKSKYSTNIFCDLFSDTFNLEGDGSLSSLEEGLFEELTKVTSRFSPYEKDLLIPNAFYNECEIDEKIKEIIQKLIQVKNSIIKNKAD